MTTEEAALESRPDSTILDYARQQKRVLLTRNCDDFAELHQAQPVHPGILAIYQNPIVRTLFCKPCCATT